LQRVSGIIVVDTDYCTFPELSGKVYFIKGPYARALGPSARDPCTQAPLVSARVETSGNGIYWATKSLIPEVAPFSVTTNATAVSPYSADPGNLPSMGFVRLRITLTLASAPVSAHVKVYVTLRDGGGEVVLSAPPWHYTPPAGHKPQGQGDDIDKPENPHIYHNPKDS